MPFANRSALEAAAAQVAARPLAPTQAFVDAWRQLHHAAQIASEVGKAWSIPRSDDSHSSFSWADGELLGAPVAVPGGLRAALRVQGLVLRLVADDGATLASKSLDAATAADGMRWLRCEAERLAGPPRQPATAAPDLPAHPPVAEGAPFAVRIAESTALERLLAGSDALLRSLARSHDSTSPVSIWPHHFDMAVLLEVAPQRTIGVGLAVPDDLEASGYWYVSPWSATPPAPAATRWSALPNGRWIERGSALRLAALPLDAWSALGDATARCEALAGFLATALDASAQNLAR